MTGGGGELGRIRGRVLDCSGAPVPDAAVLITRGPGSLPDIAQLSGDDGGFLMTDLERGEYHLLARSECGRVGEAVVIVDGSGVADAEIRV
jgi:hypothetical protein